MPSELQLAVAEIDALNPVLALEDLYDSVCTELGPAIEQPFGWREHTKQLGDLPRICWAPGDPTGSLGRFAAANRPGGNPRSLVTLFELFTVRIDGFDSADIHNERAQYRATRLLYDSWLRAMYLNAYGRFKIEEQRWNTQRNESRFGAQLQVVGSIHAVIPDEQNPAIAAGAATSEITAEVLDVSETEVSTPE
jgi:hypothetical protein